MNLVYAYPWDIVGDPAAPERLAALGVDAVALAASYHSTRAATPLHPAHRVLDVPHSALYLPVRAEAWGRLVPPRPPGPRRTLTCSRSDALRAAGLKVYAWTVLTHNAHLGQAHPGSGGTQRLRGSLPVRALPRLGGRGRLLRAAGARGAGGRASRTG